MIVRSSYLVIPHKMRSIADGGSNALIPYLQLDPPSAGFALVRDDKNGDLL